MSNYKNQHSHKKRPAIIPVGPSIAYIELASGHHVLLDSDDAYVSQWLWSLRGNLPNNAYPVRNFDGKTVALHRLLCPTDLLVDHKNGNVFDCRRSNLRPSTHSLNSANSRRKKPSQSGFRGVRADFDKWSASIQANKTRKFLGMFSTAEDAAIAYDAAAIRIWGESAVTNFKYK